MFRVVKVAVALFALAPVAASAEQWWWVAGEPGTQDAFFVDTDSIERSSANAEFRVLHLTPSTVTLVSTSEAERAKVRCAAQHASANPAIQRFVCATPEERMSLGAMLGSLTPELAAKAIFAAPKG